MKKFTVKAFLFVLPVIALLAYAEFKLSRVKNGYALKQQYFEQHLAETELLILGSSHAMDALDPAYFRVAAFNLAYVSQTIDYDVLISSANLHRMSRLRHVIITLSNFTYWTRLSDTPEQWRDFFYYRYWHLSAQHYPWHELRKYSYIMLYSPSTTLKVLLGLYTDQSVSTMSPSGWWRKDTVSAPNPELSTTLGRLKVATDERYMYQRLVPQNLKLISQFIEQCQLWGITVSFVSTPIAPYYTRYASASFQLRNQQITDSLCATYHIRYYDFTNDRSFTDRYFADNEHLNHLGAAKLSHQVDSLVFSD